MHSRIYMRQEIEDSDGSGLVEAITLARWHMNIWVKRETARWSLSA